MAELNLFYSGTSGGVEPVTHELQQLVSGVWTTLGELEVGAPFNITDLEIETPYTFRTFSEDAAGQTVYSPEAVFQIPDPLAGTVYMLIEGLDIDTTCQAYAVTGTSARIVAPADPDILFNDLIWEDSVGNYPEWPLPDRPINDVADLASTMTLNYFGRAFGEPPTTACGTTPTASGETNKLRIDIRQVSTTEYKLRVFWNTNVGDNQQFLTSETFTAAEWPSEVTDPALVLTLSETTASGPFVTTAGTITIGLNPFFDAIYFDMFSYADGGLEAGSDWTDVTTSGAFPNGLQVVGGQVTVESGGANIGTASAYDAMGVTLDRTLDWELSWKLAIPETTVALTGRTFTIRIGTGTTSTLSGDMLVAIKTRTGAITEIEYTEPGFGTLLDEDIIVGDGVLHEYRMAYTVSDDTLRIYQDDVEILSKVGPVTDFTDPTTVFVSFVTAFTGTFPASLANKFLVDDIVLTGTVV